MTPQVCFVTVPQLPRELDGLNVLASDLSTRSSDSALQVFRDIDAAVFDRTGANPFATLLATTPARLAELVTDHSFLARLETAVVERDRQATALGSWYGAANRNAPRPLAVWLPRPTLKDECSTPYFTRAAKLLESASRLGVPLVSVELECGPYDHSAPNARAAAQKPFSAVNDAAGDPLRIEIQLPQTAVVLRVLRAAWGPSSVLLLTPETGHDIWSSASTAEDAQIAAAFVQQVGAVRALNALCIDIPVWHVDRAAPFAALERIAHLSERHHVPFHVASQLVASATLTAGAHNLPTSAKSLLPYLAHHAEQLGAPVEELADLLRIITLDDIANDPGTATAADARLRELVSRVYLERANRLARSQCDDFMLARRGADHRARILSEWGDIRVTDMTPELPLRLRSGSYFDVAVAVRTRLASSDVRADITIGTLDDSGVLRPAESRPLTYSHTTDLGHVYNCRVKVPESPGTFGYSIAARPNLLAPWCHAAVAFASSEGVQLAECHRTASIA